MVIHAEQYVVTNLQNFAEHLERISDHIQTTAVIMHGLDSNLLHDKTETICQHENLGIESPTLNPLPGKDQSSGLAFEGFKATLRVFKAQSEYRLNHHLEARAA
jgi:hypothetical protein